VWLPWIFSIAQKTTFMLVPTMLVEFVIIVESRAAESAQWVPLKTSLVHSTGPVITMPHMILKVLVPE
jgi:hypothetical protein